MKEFRKRKGASTLSSSARVFEITEIKHGWAEVVFHDGEQAHQISGISYAFNDGLGSFAAAVEQIATGVLAGAECLWHHEPAVTSVWVCSKKWPHVELRIKRYRRRRLHLTVNLRDLVRDVIAAFEGVRDTYGVEGYEEQERWGHSFPQARLDALGAWLEMVEHVEARHVLRLGVHRQLYCNDVRRSVAIAEALGLPHEEVVGELGELPGPWGVELVERPDDGPHAVEAIVANVSAGAQSYREWLCQDE